MLKLKVFCVYRVCELRPSAIHFIKAVAIATGELEKINLDCKTKKKSLVKAGPRPQTLHT